MEFSKRRKTARGYHLFCLCFIHHTRSVTSRVITCNLDAWSYLYDSQLEPGKDEPVIRLCLLDGGGGSVAGCDWFMRGMMDGWIDR
jgi:hypothetical protein